MKAAVVTGVSTGIGKDIALTLCEHGYKVFGSVRSYKDAENLTQELNENFEEILKNGYAISRGERDSDIAALAVPIMNSNGTVRGALNISGLVSHFDEKFEKKFSEELKKEATKLDEALAGI